MKNVIEIATKLYLLEGGNYVWWSRAKEIFGDVDIDKLHLLFWNSELVIMEDVDGRELTYGQSKYRVTPEFVEEFIK